LIFLPTSLDVLGFLNFFFETLIRKIISTIDIGVSLSPFLHYFSGRYHTASFTQLTARLLKQCANQTVYNYLKANSKQGASFNIILNPYLPTYMDNALNAAYIQSVSSTALFPICIDFRWELSSDDHFFHQAIQSTADILLETIIDDGQYDEYTKPILYPNFALETTSLSLMYGSNLPRLQRIRQAWDPENVMYLTSGWKF
jgi:hypothetical protein